MILVNRPWYIEDQADKRKVSIAGTNKLNKIKERRELALQASHTVKHDSLWVSRSAIFANVFPSKSLFHDYPPRLVKATSPALHNSLNSFFSLLIQTLSTIPTLDIFAQVKVCTAEAGFNVVFETALAQTDVGVLSEGVQSLDGL
jgi:hypothetical protein